MSFREGEKLEEFEEIEDMEEIDDLLEIFEICEIFELFELFEETEEFEEIGDDECGIGYAFGAATFKVKFGLGNGNFCSIWILLNIEFKLGSLSLRLPVWRLL